jgi:lysophospholipase L1-like esterase
MRVVTTAPKPASAGRRRTALPHVLVATAVSALLAATAATAAGAATTAAGAAAKPVYVSLGDSYTSGPDIPTQVGTPSGCQRSDHNYPSLTAAAIGAASFTDVSCSGAVTADVTGPESVSGGTNPAQDSALSAATTVATLGMGGNDVGFVSIVTTCIELASSNPTGAPCKAHYTAGGTNQLAAAIKATAPKIAADLKAIHSHAPNAKVFVVGYPVILPNSGHGCYPNVPIAGGDVPYLRSTEKQLNKMLATQAAANGASYVDTYTDSIGHDVCQPTGVKWVEGLSPTSPAAPFHPNALGEKAMATQVTNAMTKAGI